MKTQLHPEPELIELESHHVLISCIDECAENEEEDHLSANNFEKQTLGARRIDFDLHTENDEGSLDKDSAADQEECVLTESTEPRIV